MVFGNQSHTRGATCGKRVLGNRVLGLIVVHHVVHCDKAFLQCLFVVAVFVLGELFENLDEFLLDK